MNPTTTIRRLRAEHMCQPGLARLHDWLPDGHTPDDPIAILDILDNSGASDAIWCLRGCDADEIARRLACWCADFVAGEWNITPRCAQYLLSPEGGDREGAMADAYDVAKTSLDFRARTAARCAVHACSSRINNSVFAAVSCYSWAAAKDPDDAKEVAVLIDDAGLELRQMLEEEEWTDC